MKSSCKHRGYAEVVALGTAVFAFSLLACSGQEAKKKMTHIEPMPENVSESNVLLVDLDDKGSSGTAIDGHLGISSLHVGAEWVNCFINTGCEMGRERELDGVDLELRKEVQEILQEEPVRDLRQYCGD
jgi:hypothetical protein